VFHWFGVVETADFYQTAELNTHSGSFLSQAPDDVYWKPPLTPAIQAARRSWLGRVFLDWSQFPYIEETPVPSPALTGAAATKVRFEDLRFAYNVLFLHGRRHDPLGGSVIVGSQGQIEEMRMNGQVQKMGN
jgi:inner membrane protein